MTDNVLITFIKSTPPVTRALCSIVALLIFLNIVDVLKPYQMAYSWYHLKDLQIHRAFTAPFSFGMLSVENLMHVVFLYRYSSLLEDSYFHKSDYIWILFITSLVLLLNASFIFTPHLGPSLSCTITYLWTRKNPRAFVQAYGFLTFYAFYLPFLLPLYTLISEKTIHLEEFNGIVVGQLVYYFKEVYPRFGRDFFKTPCFLHRLCSEIQDCCKVKRRSDFGTVHASRPNPIANEGVKDMNDDTSKAMDSKAVEIASDESQLSAAPEIDEFEIERHSPHDDSWDSSSYEAEEHLDADDLSHPAEHHTTMDPSPCIGRADDPLSEASSESRHFEKENISSQLHAEIKDFEHFDPAEGGAGMSVSSVLPSLGSYINSKLSELINKSVADTSNECMAGEDASSNDPSAGVSIGFSDEEPDFESDASFEELDYDEVVGIDTKLKSHDDEPTLQKTGLPQHGNEGSTDTSKEYCESDENVEECDSNQSMENNETRQGHGKSEESNTEFQSFSEEDSEECLGSCRPKEEYSDEASRDSEEDWDSA